MTDEQSTDITEFVAEIYTQTMDELQSRLEVFDALSEADVSAINTAVGKAAWRGVLTGIAVQTQAINEIENVRVHTWMHDVDEIPDHWAEHYGNES